MAAEWMPYDSQSMASLGADEQYTAALEERGLPLDTYKMFFRNADRELEVRDLPESGRSAFLGQFEDGVNTYCLNLDDGTVWILRGYDGGPQQMGWINSSVVALQKILEIWDGFIGSGVYEDDERYEGLVAETIEQAQQADPRAFEDEESWWSRVFEEIEFGVLRSSRVGWLGVRAAAWLWGGMADPFGMAFVAGVFRGSSGGPGANAT